MTLWASAEQARILNTYFASSSSFWSSATSRSCLVLRAASSAVTLASCCWAWFAVSDSSSARASDSSSWICSWDWRDWRCELDYKRMQWKVNSIVKTTLFKLQVSGILCLLWFPKRLELRTSPNQSHHIKSGRAKFLIIVVQLQGSNEAVRVKCPGFRHQIYYRGEAMMPVLEFTAGLTCY